MTNLIRGTRQADTAVEPCTCYRGCDQDETTACGTASWHAHDDDPCALHPGPLRPETR